MVIHHLAKFDDHRHTGSGDMIILTFHLTLKDQVMKASYDFMVKSSTK